MPVGKTPSPPASAPPPTESRDALRFADGAVPEAPPRPRGWLVFGLVVFLTVAVTLLWSLSRRTPFLLVGGIYFPAWFSAAVIGGAFATVTVLALRSFSLTRAAGTGLVFFNCAVIYAFLVWLLLFT